MGIRGPAPKPNALRLIQGDLSKGKVKPNRREPIPSAAAVILEPPPWMDPKASSVFLLLRPELPWLTVVDVHLLAAYCCAFVRWRQAEDALTAHGLTVIYEREDDKPVYTQQRPELSIAKSYFDQMMKAGAALGLSPSARTRIQVNSPKEEETNDKAMFG